MKILRNLLYAAVILALPLVASAAAPTIKVKAPSKKATTSGTLNASGTAKAGKGSAAITGVFYSLNNGPWTQATGTTAWTANNLQLAGGENTFASYAIDGNSVASKTNLVTFQYLVQVPIALHVGAGGTVSSITDGELLQIGKLYKASAKAEKGFMFTGWTGGINSTSPKIGFVMASNFVLNATFADATRPACVIVFPAVKQSLSNSPINITGRASDNLAVAAVHYQLNHAGWNLATLTVGGNWEADNQPLVSGTNTAQAYAVDAAGNVSLTNTVNFTFVTNTPPPPPPPASIAPASLDGLVAEMNPDGLNAYEISFGLNTYALPDTNNLNNANVGNYTYTVISTNQALFHSTGALPPYDFELQAGYLFTFTSPSNATYVDGDNVTGTADFHSTPSNFSLAVPPSLIFGIEADSYFGTTNFLSVDSGKFTNTDSGGNLTWGSYTYGLFSQAGSEAVELFQDPADAGNSSYFQMEFFNQSGGVYIANTFDPSLNFLGGDVGEFHVTNLELQPTGFAPDSIAGAQWVVSVSGKPSFTLTFGANSYGESGASADNTSVGDYTYVKTGANTAQYQNAQIAPPTGLGAGAVIQITFKSATSANFVRTEVDNGHTNVTTGSAKISTAATVAPATLSGKQIVAKLSSHTSTINLIGDGTFTKSTTGGGQDSGSYTYTPYSPNTGIVTLHTTSGTDTGENSYGVLTFSSATAGNIATSDFDLGGAELDHDSGTFTVQ